MREDEIKLKFLGSSELESIKHEMPYWCFLEEEQKKREEKVNWDEFTVTNSNMADSWVEKIVDYDNQLTDGEKYVKTQGNPKENPYGTV